MKTKKDFLGRTFHFKCLGCDISNIQDFLIKETPNFYIMQDIEVPLKGFLAISSKKHITSMTDLSSEELQELIFYISQSIKALKEIFDIEEVFSYSKDMPNRHFHYSILPRHKELEKYGDKLSGISDICQDYKNKENREKEILETQESILKLREYFKGEL